MAQDATLEAASESRKTKWLIALFKSMTNTQSQNGVAIATLLQGSVKLQ